MKAAVVTATVMKRVIAGRLPAPIQTTSKSTNMPALLGPVWAWAVVSPSTREWKICAARWLANTCASRLLKVQTIAPPKRRS